jgi:hypothetical protein
VDEQPQNKRAVYAVIAFFFLVGLGMIVGAFFQHRDETTGTAGTARVTSCHSHQVPNSVDCVGTWTVDGRRVVDGPIENAKANQVGKTVSVRIHGERATIPTLWISIALAAMGVAIAAFAVWLLMRFRKQFQAT